MKVHGKMMYQKEMAILYLIVENISKDNLLMVRLMEKEYLFITMVILMKETYLKIKQMDLENILERSFNFKAFGQIQNLKQEHLEINKQVQQL